MAGIFSSDKKKKEEESRQGSSFGIFSGTTQKATLNTQSKQTTPKQPVQKQAAPKQTTPNRTSSLSGTAAGSNSLGNPAGRDTVSITGIANNFIKQNNMAYARGDLDRNSWATAYKAISDRLKSETNDKNKANHDALLKTMQAQGRKFFTEETIRSFPLATGSIVVPDISRKEVPQQGQFLPGYSSIDFRKKTGQIDPVGNRTLYTPKQKEPEPQQDFVYPMGMTRVPTYDDSPIQFSLMTPEKYENNSGTHPIGQKGDQNYLYDPKMLKDPASALKNPNTVWGQLAQLSDQKVENERKIQNAALYFANGANPAYMSDKELEFYEGAIENQRDRVNGYAERWNQDILNLPKSEVNRDAYVKQEADKKREEIINREGRPDYGDTFFTDEEQLEITQAENEAIQRYNETPERTMPASWQDTGYYGTALDKIDAEMKDRDFQREYVGYTQNDDWDDNNGYVPAKVTKDLTQLEAAEPGLLAEQQSSIKNDPKILDDYQNIWHEAINGDEDAIYYLTHIRTAFSQNDEYSENPFVEQYMSDYEKSIFNYLWNTGDKEKAAEYVDGLNIELWKRAWTAADEATRARLESMPGWALVANYILMPAVGLLENQANAWLAAEDVLSGREINPWRMSNVASTTQQVMEQRTRDYGERHGWSTTAQDLVTMGEQMYFSGAQSFLSLSFSSVGAGALGLTGDVFNQATQMFSLGLMSTGAGAQTLQTELMQGIPQDRAMKDAITSGIIEFATEKIGMDNLFNGPWNSKNAFVTMLKQMLAEGSEELVGDFATDAMGQLWDLVDGTSYSELNTKAYAYILQNGLAPADKEMVMAQIMSDRLVEYAKDFAIGAGSTAFGEAPAGAIKSFSNAESIASKVPTMQASSVIDFAIENTDEDTKAYKRAMDLRDSLARGEVTDPKEFQKAVRGVARAAVYEVQAIEDPDERKETFDTMLSSFGIKYLLTPDVQRSEPENVEGTDTISNDAVETVSRAEQVNKDNQYVQNAVSLAIAAQANMTDPMQPDEVERTIDSFVKGEGTPDLSKTGLGDDTIAELNNIAERRQMTEVMDDIVNEGNTAKPSPESTETAPEVETEETPAEELASGAGRDTVARQMESKPSYYNTLSEEGKRAYNQVMNEAKAVNMPESEAQTAFQMLYDAGTSQIPYLPTRGIRSLSEWTRNSVYGLGYQESLQETKGIQNRGFTKASAAGVARTPIVDNAIKEGKVSNKTVNIIDRFAKKMGIRVNFVPTADYNGQYVMGGNVVRIALDSTFYHAGDADRMILGTFGHELTHRMQDVSPEIYREFADLVAKAMGNSEFTRKVNREIQRDSRLSPVQAQTEVISDFVGTQMFLDTKFADKFLDGITVDTEEKRTALQGLRDFVRKALAWIRGNRNELKNARQTEDKLLSLEKSLTNLIEKSAQAVKQGGTMTENELRDGLADAHDVRDSRRYVDQHMEDLNKYYSASDSITDLDTIKSRYAAVVALWDDLGGEINSQFLEEWNNKIGKDRQFSVFKAQSGYKYNIELSSMCKKGVPLFEAIDQIVRKEVMKRLNTDALTKAEKEILYDLLKAKGFEIPCAICYVEQARQGEGRIIRNFLNGSEDGKIGWNTTLHDIERRMAAKGVEYTFPAMDRSIATDGYAAPEVSMDERTQQAFYESLMEATNEEITKWNEANPKKKPKQLLTEATPAEVNKKLRGSLGLNFVLFKALFNEPQSRVVIDEDLLYSSMTTLNLTAQHNKLYKLFNQQGGTGGYKTKQAPVVYWGDLLRKKYRPSTVRKEGGIRSQSNSDTQMYTFLDKVQMYLDFTAKGYYLHEYTKTLTALKLFGKSGAKLNASLIPAVHIYRDSDGKVDLARTQENAGLDKNGNLYFDDIEGINHDEAFMIIEDPEYSKNVCGICIGYSDKHISRLLDDPRVQLIIGYHDKTNDINKRYRGARYAHNYNGENEATKADGTTVYVGFNGYVIQAEKMFKKNQQTVEFNGKTYRYDDIPKLAADMYLSEYDVPGKYSPAYPQFKDHENYYKLLADFGLYDSEGHYAPHNKVDFQLPDTVPYLENGVRKEMSSRDYIKNELTAELKVRDDIAAELSDDSSDGIMSQFVERVNRLHEQQEETPEADVRNSARDSVGNVLSNGQQEFFKDSKVRDKDGNLLVVYHGTYEDFSVFKADEWSNEADGDNLIKGYFSEDEEFSKSYGDTSPYYLNITNPLEVGDEVRTLDGWKEWFASQGIKGVKFDSGIQQDTLKGGNFDGKTTYMLFELVAAGGSYWNGDGNVTHKIQEAGYDGIHWGYDENAWMPFRENAIKRTDNQNPTDNQDIRYSTRDSEYMNAVNSGDMDAAQRMVDEAAKEAGYTVSTFHGTGEYFNIFRMGAEGIHLGNEAQARQVAGIRFDMRSKTSTYKWGDIRNDVGKMNTEQRESLLASAYYMGDYYNVDPNSIVYTPFDGDVNDVDAVTQYVNTAVSEYQSATGSDDVSIRMRTFDRNTGENVMHLYAKLNNPFTVNGDIVEWSPYNIADVLMQRNNGETSIKPWFKDAPIDISGSDIKLTKEDYSTLVQISEGKIKGDDAWSAIADILSNYGYDGIKYINQYEGDKNSYSYIALKPSDVKLADPVTYDDNGNVIPLSERFNMENRDTRYSARDENAVNDYADIIARNQQREQARALLGNPASWRQSNVKLDALGLRKKTIGMLNQFGDLISANQREKVVKDVAKLANDMLHGRETDLYDIEMKAANIASDVVFFSYGEKDAEARDAMMDDPRVEAAIDNITDYILANIASTQSYQARELQRQTEKNKNLRDTLDTVRQKRDTEIRRIMDANKERQSYQVKKLQKQIENNQKLKDLLKTVREKRDAEIRRRIDAGKERQRAKQDSELRKSILKRGKRLEGMKMSDANKALKEQLIGGMNLDVTHLTDGQKNNITELLAWAAEQEQNSDFVMSESVRKQLSMVNQTYLDDIISKDDPDAINKLRLLNEALKELEYSIRTQNRLIDDADNRELREIAYDEDEILNNVNGTTEGWKRNLDKIFVQGTLSPMRFMHRLTGYVEKSGLYRLAKAIDEGGIKKLAYQSRAVQMFDKWMSDKKLVRSWAGKKADIKTYDYIAPDGKQAHLELTPGMRMTLYLASKDYGWMRHMCGVDTPDGHLDGRGITLPKMSSYKKGKISYSGAETYRITRSILNKIIADMSAEERAFADKANEFFNGMQKDALNATSQQLIGRDIALVDDYLPITVDDRFLGKDYGTIKMDGTVEGIGSLKERVESGAPVFVRDLTDILMQSIESTSSYVGLAVPITNFNKLMKAKLGAVDANGVFRTGETTLKNTIDAKWGDTALNYIDKMIADIQHPNYVREDLDKAFAKIRSNYARSVLTLNLSVGLKQGASYPTAAAIVGWKALSKAFVNYKHVDLDLIRKYTPLLWYRSRGFVNPELGTIKNGSVWDNLPKGLDWITGIDFLTTRKLWKAAEYYVQDAQPGLYKPGAGIYGQSNEYYEAVAEVYNQVIEETQPNYTPWQRPQYLRSHSGITQMLMMFKTQPFQNFNVLYDAIGNYRAKVREMKINGQSREVQQAYKEAGKKLRWAITSQIGQLVTFAAMTMLWNIFRRKKEKYTDEDGNFSLEVMFQNMGKDIGSGVFGMIPFGSDAWSLISSKLFGDKYYGFESVTDSVIGDLLDSVSTAWDTMSKLVTSGDPFDLTTYKSKIKSVGTAVAKLFGIPAENVFNIMTALYKRGRDMTEDRYMADLYAMAWDVNPEQNKKDFVNIAYRAYNNGDMESYGELKDFYRDEWGWDEEDVINKNLRTLYAAQFGDSGLTPAYQNLYDLYKTDEDNFLFEYNKMEELGFSEDQLKKGIESCMKEEAGVDSVNDLEERFITPEEEIRKEEELRPLHESKAWENANEAERETLEDYADKYNNSDTKQWTVAREGVDAGALTFDEYMQFMLALTNVDQPTESGKYGSYTTDEVKAAIEEMGWTNEQARELWQYLPKYNSNNPYETVQEEKKEPALETIPEPEPEPEPEPASLSGSDLNAGDLKKIEKSEDVSTPESSWISNIHYNPNTQTLTVTTKGGRTYTHSGVSKDTYTDFKNAPSKGRWYNAHF